jgi:signal transduction histidine kinase/ActR/RegA family two-component response regulator
VKRGGPFDYCALVLAPTGKDAELTTAALRQHAIGAEACTSVDDLAAKSLRGVGAVVLAEEALAAGAARLAMKQLIDQQPSWSDLPVVLLSKRGPLSATAADAITTLGNVMVLERPTQIASLVSAVLTALRSRERQYMLRIADERKDEFMATLAHELRNPLAPLTHALHILKREDTGPTKQRWAVDVIQRQSLQLRRLVDDLLDVARITQGKVSLQLQDVDLREVVRNAMEISGPLIESMQHELVTQLPADAVLVRADAVRLAQCLSNLLNNAAKYTPRGGRIELHASVHEKHFELQVRDSGEGIAADAMEQLFGIFAQHDRSRPRAQGGMGVGLWIVKTFVEMHGGNVEVHSGGEGKGSTFIVRVPHTALPAASPAAPAMPHAPQDEQRCRILVVDDNTDNADSLSELLALCGHEVHKAYDGESALHVASQVLPDVAILDIGLPDIDGREVARRMRADGATARAMLIALSGWGQPADRELSSAAGFDQHLVKPADLGQILELIRNALARPLVH